MCFNCHRVGYISRSCPKPRANRYNSNYGESHVLNWRWKEREGNIDILRGLLTTEKKLEIDIVLSTKVDIAAR